MEIIIQFEYVTLFASAYPLASLISIVANLIEMQADMFKITYVCRRPRSSRCDGLNMWNKLLVYIVWLSVMLNWRRKFLFRSFEKCSKSTFLIWIKSARKWWRGASEMICWLSKGRVVKAPSFNGILYTSWGWYVSLMYAYNMPDLPSYRLKIT